jgi:hypothetical protein
MLDCKVFVLSQWEWESSDLDRRFIFNQDYILRHQEGLPVSFKHNAKLFS